MILDLCSFLLPTSGRGQVRHPRAYGAMLKDRLRRGGPISLTTALAVVCWSGICGLGSIEIGSLGPINTLPFDHTSVCPESLLGLLPDINKPPLARQDLMATLDITQQAIVKETLRAAATKIRELKDDAIAASDHRGSASLATIEGRIPNLASTEREFVSPSRICWSYLGCLTPM